MKNKQVFVIAAMAVVLIVVVVMLVVEKGKNRATTPGSLANGDTRTYQLSAVERSGGLVFPDSGRSLMKRDMTLLTLGDSTFRFVYPESDGLRTLSGDLKRDPKDRQKVTFQVREAMGQGISAATEIGKLSKLISSLSEVEQAILKNEHKLVFPEDGILAEITATLEEHDDGTLVVTYHESKPFIPNPQRFGVPSTEYLSRWEGYDPLPLEPGDSN